MENNVINANSANTKRNRLPSSVKTYKTKDRFIELYGREAYEAWKDREVEINILKEDRRHYDVYAIVKMREDNYRQLKAAGEARSRVIAAACKANVSAAA